MQPLNDERPDRRLTITDRMRWLSTILRDEFGVPFRFHVAANDWEAQPPDQPGQPPEPERDDRNWLVRFGALEQAELTPIPGEGYRLALSFHEDGAPSLIAIGLKTTVSRPHPDSIREEIFRLEKWLGAVFDRLRLAGRTEARHRAEPAKPAPAVDPWEVIVRLEQLMRVQKTHKEPGKNRRRLLRSAGELVAAQSLVYVPVNAADQITSVGEELLSPWDSSQLAMMLSKTVDWEESGYLIRNDFAKDMTAAARFPQIINLMIFPVVDVTPIGWLIVANKRSHQGPRPKPDKALTDSNDRPAELAAAMADQAILPFRRGDAAMIAPFASLLGFHARAYQSYNHLRQLLVGLTRSLTSAIDAKDSYTFGHSERVARVAVELGRELGLPEEELSDIYLAGLLHDIGKIGIRDEVLGKTAPLDAAEFEHIKEHVKIGYRILSGLNAISHLLPGVLYHHERIDGKGYPEGLKGNAIPFIARILAVADSYDAMSTSRPYRVALPPDKVERILIEGSNTQWEKAVIDAFLRCKDRINGIRQRGVGESLSGALDDALKKGSGNREHSSMVSILVK